MDLLRNRLRRIEGMAVHPGTETPFNLHFGRLEVIREPPCTLLSILLQPAEVIANGIPDFRFSADKPGRHALSVFGAVDVSTDLNLDLR